MTRGSTLLAPLVALACLGHGLGTAHAAEPEMSLAGNAFAPPAFETFCKRHKSLCDSQSGAKVVKLTPGRQKQLSAINAELNRTIRQREDRETTGKDDDWRLATREGDCEDIAIAKKAALMRSGWPASSLLLTVARQPYSDDGHTVLTVRTDAGDLVLDNLTSRVKAWSATPYRYFARQSQTRTGKWERIGAGQ